MHFLPNVYPVYQVETTCFMIVEMLVLPWWFRVISR